jgi:hypothetical protein
MYRSSRLHQVRRYAAGACCALAALSLGIALAASSPASQPATRRAVPAADKAAADAQFDKAKALYDQKKFAEAQAENDKALKLDPANVNAVLLQGLLKNALAAGGSSASSSPVTVVAQGRIPLLTNAQITVIRILELSPDDTRLAGRIDPKVLEDFWQNVVVKDVTEVSTKAAHDAFVNPANFANQVRRIRQNRDSKYMEKVTLNTDPASFALYRGSVQNFALQNCATAECHSERGQGGNFRLLNPATGPDQQYTNFFILTQYANADGPMVDRANPDKSLLFQYALPWVNAAAPHPKVDIRKLSGPNDSRVRTLFQWINSLAFPKPIYDLKYTVPGAATVPVSAPAATAPSK